MESKITATQISEHIWQFNEANENGPYVDAYLICGAKRALVVDSLQTLPDLYDRVREKTDLPLQVLITHGHGDHAGASLQKFREAGVAIFMDLRDYPILKGGFSDSVCEEDWFTDVAEGKRFDLGGYCFEVISVPGHSPGSLVAYDRENKLMFSGDTIGSGHFWMQIPTALPLFMFDWELEKLYQTTRADPEILIYPGHRNQSPIQLTGQYIKDTRTITKGLLSGILQGEPTSLDFGGRKMEYYHIAYGQMCDFCYDPDRLHSDGPTSETERIKDSFEHRVMRGGGFALDYMLFTPEVKEGETYPLVLYLHGAGERGDNPRRALQNDGATNFASKAFQAEYPCFVLAPLCPEGESWNHQGFMKLMAETIQQLSHSCPVNACRVYVTGLSMGGMGTWALISKYPKLFAAAMPICGGGGPFAVRAAKNVPVWAFHAEDDPIVPVTGSFGGLREEPLVGTRMMVSSLRGTGNSNVKYTEYPTGYMNDVMHLGAHMSWVPAYGNEEALRWMFRQTRFDKYEVELVRPGLWHIEDCNDDSIYVVEGKDKALVIDTGLGGGDFIGLIESLTRLPYELAVTHVHHDHMKHSDRFGKFFMSQKEAPLMPEFFARGMPDSKTTADDIMDIQSGDTIDLGGGVVIEVLEVPGHSPGSCVLFDRAHGACFTGDALGVWLQVPGALDISTYRDALRRFDEKLREPDYEGLFFLGGHRRQEGGYFPYGDQYRPGSPERVRDMITLCDLILSDEAELKPYPVSFGEQAVIAEYGTASMVFCLSRKK